MVTSYCVVHKRKTECIEPSGYKQAKNGRWMFYCTCAEMKNGKKHIKTKFISNKKAEELGFEVKKSTKKPTAKKRTTKRKSKD